jgi:hypothetical protein
MKAPGSDPESSDPSRPGSGRQSSPMAWIRRLGWAGFCFFLIKGLLWLAAPGLILWWRSW